MRGRFCPPFTNGTPNLFHLPAPLDRVNNIYLFMISRWVRTKRRPGSFEATFPMVMDVLESTGSILEVVETLVVSITIASTLTSTILVTLERLEWKISLMDIFFQNGMTTKTWASAVGSFENNTILYLKYFLPYLVLLGKESCLS